MNLIGTAHLKRKIFLFLLLAVGCTIATAAENDFSKVNIEAAFRPYLTSRKSTMQTPGVKEFKTFDKKRIVVCVASTPNKGQNSSALSKMIKVCRIKAQVELLKADGYELSAFTKVEDRIVQVSDGTREKMESLSSFLDVAEEKVNGTVRSWPVVGTWFSGDGEEFYLAIGVILR